MTNKITEQEEWIDELRMEIKHKNLTIARMSQTPLITDDMIAEALDNKVDPDEYDTLRVIFNSWGGNPIDNTDAISSFKYILKRIRGCE